MTEGKPAASRTLKISGLPTFEFGTCFCTIAIPEDQHSFETIEELWKDACWLDVSIASNIIEKNAVEKVRQYKFLAQIDVVQQSEKSAVVKFSMYESKPDIIIINLNENTSKSAYD